MKNKIVIILLGLIILLIFSCNQDNNSVDSELIIDAKNLSDSSIPISSFTRVTIKNMDESVLYAVKAEGTSRGILPRGNNPKAIFPIDRDRFIPIPDEQNRSIFTGEDVGISSSGKISVIVLKDGSIDNMTLDETNEDQFVYTIGDYSVFEEFYHIDFTKEPFSKLDRKDIVISSFTSGGGACFTNHGYVTIGEGGVIGSVKFASRVFDFSDKNSINLFSSLGVKDGNWNPIKFKLGVVNPIKLVIGDKHSLGTNHEVISLDPQSEGSEFVIEIEREDGVYYSDNFDFRFTDGIFSDIPLCLIEGSDRIIYYLGEVKDRLIGEIKTILDEEFQGNPSHYGKITFRETDEDERALYKKRVLNVSEDDEFELNGTKTFNIKIPQEQYRELSFHVRPIDKLSNVKIEVEYVAEDNSQFSENDYLYSGIRSSHYNGVGYSNYGKEGSNVTFIANQTDYLERITVQAYVHKDVNVKITISKIDE